MFRPELRLPLLIAAASCWISGQAWAAPTISAITPAPGSTVATLTSVSVTFSEPVTGVAATDLGVNGELTDAVSGSGAGPYVFTFPQPLAGLVSLGWDVDQSIAGIGTGEFAPAGGWSYTLTDSIAPTFAKIGTSVAGQEMDNVRPIAGSTVGILTRATVVFSEPVAGVEAGDLLVNGAPATSLTGDAAGPYYFNFPAPPDGAVSFTWSAAHGIADAAGNAFAGTPWSATKAASAGQLLITEFMASNGGGAVATGSDADGTRDENWDLSGWIEIHNPGAAAVNLLGWSLTDDTDTPDQWIFPARTIGAGARLVVFASEKNRKPATGNLHTSFALAANGGTLALYAPDSSAAAPVPASAWIDYPAQRYDYSYGAQVSDGAPRYFRPGTISQGAYIAPSTDAGAPAPTVPPAPLGVANGDSTLTSLTPDPTSSVQRGFFSAPFATVLSCQDATATIRYTLDGSVPLATSPAYTGALNIAGTTVLRFAAFGTGKVPSRTITHTYLFPDTVVNQPSPPYNNPALTTDNTNPEPPSPGGSPLPIAWGTNGTITAAQTLTGFPTGTATGSNNLTGGQVPADYGMDPKVYADPTKYNDAGAIDPANGRTNRERIATALRTLPALSLVIKSGDMFGAYPNGTIPSGTTDPLYPTSSSGIKRDMTKPCSLELIQADGTTVFVVDAGVDLHGNASRDPFKNPKHGFTLRFKGKYGAGKLQAKLFPDSPVTSWDKLVLRGDFGGSWLHQNGGDTLNPSDDSSQRPRGIRIREAFCKDTFRDMGGAASHHRFCNLFINGVCWGNYELMEDEAEDFASSYFGGEKDDYDVVDQGKLKSGTWNAWSAMKLLLGWTGGTPTTDRTTAPSAATFLSAFTNAQYETLRASLDLPWFQDYMIHHLYFGHRDWATAAGDAGAYMKNVYFIRPKNGPYKVMPWDMENLMWHQNEDRVTGMTSFTAGAPTLFPPAAIHPRAKNNAEYRLEFADRAWRHLVRPGGALTPPVITARLDKWTAIVNNDAICLESARWGDYRYKVHPYISGTMTQVYTWNGSWYDGTGAGYANGSWTGGSLRFNTGHTASNLGTWTTSMANAWYDEIRRLKTAYYPVRADNLLTQFRANGLYPYLNAPALRNNADDSLMADSTVPAGTQVKLVMPTAAANTSSAGDIYYTTDGTDPRPPYDLSGSPRAGATLYTAPITISAPTVIKARAFAKPGNFVQKPAVRAASPGANVTGTYNSTGGTSARGQITGAPSTLDGVTLATGDRILLKNQSTAAANGIWTVTTPGTGATGTWDRATDWDADGEVANGTWVTVNAGTQNEKSVWRVTNTAAITVGGATGTAVTLTAFSGWSALVEYTLNVGPPLASVSITEINYNPKNSQGGSAAEFVEFVNHGALPVTMSAWSMDGIDFVFPTGFVLRPGNRVVIASNENPALFASLYPGVVPLGYFGGSLSNGGERISLLDAAGNIVSSVEYDDTFPWPTTPDNGGYALEIVDPAGDSQSSTNWRASSTLGGSPGTAGTAPAAAPVVLNEFLTNAGAYTFAGVPADFAELRNTGASPVDVSGWSLRADPGNLLAIIPPGTTLAPGAFLTIHAAPSALPAPAFAATLSDTHGTLQLFNAAGQVQDGVRYGPQAAGYSFNRLGSVWQLGTPTPGAATAPATTESLAALRLNEWFPNPRPGDDDWLELYHNGSASPIVLTGATVEVNGARATITVPAAVLPGFWARWVMNPGSARGDALLLSLPASGATLRLLGTAAETVDSLTYAALATNLSGGRLPDGGATLNPALAPSPGFQNAAPAVSPLVINEVLVRNATGPAAPWARRPAWVEISNLAGPGTQSLDGWKLRTVGTAPATWNFPSGLGLAPGSHLRLWCDPTQSASLAAGLNLSTGFNLAPTASWGLELIQPSGHVAQSLLWGAQIPDRSFGYTGSGYALLTSPTPGAANAAAATLDPSSQVRLNEWFGGDSPETGNFVEIFHPGANPVDLGGLWLGDAPSESGLRRWQIPALSFIAPQSHLLLTASGPAGSPAVLGFDIAKGGEYLRLSTNDAPASPIDEQNFPSFSPLVSQGRLSDGTATLTSMNPTPGFTNAALGGQLITAHPESLVTSGGSPASFSITAPGATSWQWKLNDVDIPGATNATYAVSPWAAPATAGVYTCTVTGLAGSATSNPAVLTVLNNFTTYCAIHNIPANPGADADGDGLSNALEFLTGSDPRVPASPALSNFLVQPVFQSDPAGLSLGYDLALDPNAVYSKIRGNLSPDLTLWETRDADSTTPIANGSRLLWNIPANSPRYFLRLWLDQ